MIALVAAYAVALQTLMPAFAVMASASGGQSGFFLEICTNAVNSNGELPRGHDNGCTHGFACLTAGSFNMAGLSPEHVQFAPDMSRLAILALHAVERAASPTGVPHSARAPPHA
jgi:hypothetical protein